MEKSKLNTRKICDGTLIPIIFDNFEDVNCATQMQYSKFVQVFKNKRSNN